MLFLVLIVTFSINLVDIHVPFVPGFEYSREKNVKK